MPQLLGKRIYFEVMLIQIEIRHLIRIAGVPIFTCGCYLWIEC